MPNSVERVLSDEQEAGATVVATGGCEERSDALESLQSLSGRTWYDPVAELPFQELEGILDRRARLYDQPSELNRAEYHEEGTPSGSSTLDEISSRRDRSLRADRLHPMKAARLAREERRRAGMAKRSGDNHYKRRLKRRREKYWRVERKYKLKRDEWMRTTAEGLWFHYKNKWKRKKVSFTISEDEFLSLMYTMVPSQSGNGLASSDSKYIYEYMFSIYRLDITKPISIDNITILDRYSNTKLY